ncbi:hypothetical protein NE237_018353 [Protea cynaroides]|uniref:Uncharacterized protein n=1 Tax=Protea cynaroides TaxID=273540 RepID=A0A9Q0K9T4_9MAGN|nr:hypothetical protein NE237_018353 [Protea cynaroides]
MDLEDGKRFCMNVVRLQEAFISSNKTQGLREVESIREAQGKVRRVSCRTRLLQRGNPQIQKAQEYGYLVRVFVFLTVFREGCQSLPISTNCPRNPALYALESKNKDATTAFRFDFYMENLCVALNYIVGRYFYFTGLIILCGLQHSQVEYWALEMADPTSDLISKIRE